jgi:branched-chain amino acid transport system ATP-binding protein
MALLEVRHLTKRFGGLTANDDVSFQIAAGDLLGVIGPNGAGKSTLFNCIAGVHALDGGAILIDGHDTTRLKAHQVARLGLARTFQIHVAAGDLNVVENVMVGCFLRTRLRSRAKRQAQEILRDFGLQDVAGNLVSELPVAARKRVAMAAAIGTRPRLLLLDEVAAGLNPSEVEDVMALIQHVHQDLGVTVMLIEHVMEMVMAISRRVIVLDYGRKIAEGAPEAIVKDPNVIKAYLGERYVREHAAELGPGDGPGN